MAGEAPEPREAQPLSEPTAALQPLPHVWRTIFLRLLMCLSIALTFGSEVALAQETSVEAPVVTPYRPSVSTPAALSAPGWLEIEAGWFSANGGALPRREALPYTFKLAFTPDWGIRVDGEAVVLVPDQEGQTVAGFGDTTFVLKRRFAVDDRSAFGLELQVGTVTAEPPFRSSSGRTDYTVNGIYSVDIGDAYHADFNYSLTRLGAVGPAEGRDQKLWAAALSRTLGTRWGIMGEISGTDQTGVARTRQFLLAASFTSKRSVSWDFGVARGMTAASPAWTLFAGVTTFFRLF